VIPANSDASGSRGRVFDVQRWSLHDGPGIRTTVFLKGCPIECRWCSNPESQASHPEMAYFASRCIQAHRCVGLCPHGAITLDDDGRPVTDWAVCRNRCYNIVEPPFPCTTQCYSGARKTIGASMTVDEVLAEVMKDAKIYEESGGGITVSGGEPMNQSKFVRELLRAAKENWVNTAMETCGYATWRSYESVLEHVDFLFLDLKVFDPIRHEDLTGQGNQLILENAPRIAEFMRRKGAPMVVRIPIVPGLTDSPDNVESIADFVRERMPGVATIELMPYHRLGRGKYADIGLPYYLDQLAPPTEGQMRPLREILTGRGFAVAY
jgi:pyruvate formate lyase activating enzyme